LVPDPLVLKPQDQAGAPAPAPDRNRTRRKPVPAGQINNGNPVDSAGIQPRGISTSQGQKPPPGLAEATAGSLQKMECRVR